MTFFISKHTFIFVTTYRLFTAVEVDEDGGCDVHAVELDEAEDAVAELLDFGEVELLAVGGEVVEEGFRKIRVHVAAESYCIPV